MDTNEEIKRHSEAVLLLNAINAMRTRRLLFVRNVQETPDFWRERRPYWANRADSCYRGELRMISAYEKKFGRSSSTNNTSRSLYPIYGNRKCVEL